MECVLAVAADSAGPAMGLWVGWATPKIISPLCAQIQFPYLAKYKPFPAFYPGQNKTSKSLK
jgi:hypothetical protein